MISNERFLSAFSILIAFIGVVFLVGDAVVRDYALVFAALAALSIAAALSIVLVPRPRGEGDDAWESVAWGKWFVAAVYASIAAACIVAVIHTPDAARVAHALRAAL